MTNRNYIKGQLAKLLASENVTIVYQPKPGSSFDYKNRVLALPIIQDNVSNEMYNMMIGREAARALFSQENVNPSRIYHTIDAERPEWGKTLYDIADGIRTERKIKKQYPGLARDFNSAYGEIFKKIAPNPTAFDPNYCGLVDRINAHFRLGGMANIDFDDEEKKVVKVFEDMETHQDAIDAARLLRQFIDAPPPDQNGEGGDDDGEGQEGDGEEGQGKGKGKSKGESQGKGKDKGQGAGESDQDQDQDGQDENQDGSGSGNGDDSEDDQKESGDVSDNGNGDVDSEDESDGDTDNSGDGKDKKDSKSQDAKNGGNPLKPGGRANGTVKPNPKIHNSDMSTKLSNSIDSNVDRNANQIDQGLFPEQLDPNNWIVPYKQIHSRLNQTFGTSKVNLPVSSAMNELKKWNDTNRPTITAMMAEFERRKRASLYKRSQTAKTGMLDTGKLQYAMYSEDIFKRITSIPEAKNHGMIMIIDWSGSMSGNMAGTINQLMNLVEFCRRMRIPHEVYAFSDGSDHQIKYTSKMKQVNPTTCVWPTRFKLLQFFSDEMSHSEYQDALLNMNQIRNFYSNSRYGRSNGSINMSGLGLCGTPLNSAILVSPFLIERLRERTRAEILKCIILTDGQSNPGLNTVAGGSVGGYNDVTNLSDRKTGFSRLSKGSIEFTGSLIEAASKRANASYVGIYLVDNGYTGSISNFESLINSVTGNTKTSKAFDSQKSIKMMQDEGFCVVESFGFDEYYLLNPNAKGKAAVKHTNVGVNVTSDQLAKEITDKMNSRRVNRSLLGRFIEKLAV